MFGDSWILILVEWTRDNIRSGGLIAVAIVFVSIFIRVLMTRKKKSKCTCEDVLCVLQQTKLFPISVNHGWKLIDLWFEHRIWHYRLKSNPKIDYHVYGCFSKVRGSAQSTLNTLVDIERFSEWKVGLTTANQMLDTQKLVPVALAPDNASPSSPRKPSGDDSFLQVDIISRADDDNSSQQVDGKPLSRLRKWLRSVFRQAPHKIYRFWNKEANGCCWLLEMNTQQQEWDFFLAQPVDKWFEIDQCLLSVFCGYPSSTPAPHNIHRTAKLLTSMQNYTLYRKLQVTPLTSLTLLQDDFKEENAQESSAQQQDNTSASSKARLMFEDVVAKFREENKSESALVKRFRTMIEEKKEWYEEKKRKAAATKGASTRSSEEANRILQEKPVVDYVDSLKTPTNDNQSVKEEASPAKSNAETGGGSINDDILSFGEKIKRKFSEVSRRRKSTDDLMRGESTEKEDKVPTTASGKQDIRKEDELETAYMQAGRETATEITSIKAKISNINIRLPYEQQAERSGGWIYCGLEKEVVILRRIYSAGVALQSYLGKGIIACPPKTVFEALKNPRTRFTYDDMLKKMDLVHEFANGSKIVHWQHEVSQLFKKEARDFCVLQLELIEKGKYVIGLRSVSWPGCAERDDVPRAKLHASGWVIEPVLKDQQLHSMVTYVTQMEFGAGKSSNGYLVEELAAKQPLSIAYLRNYLIPNSISGSQSSSQIQTSNYPERSHSSRRSSLSRLEHQDSWNKMETLAALAAQEDNQTLIQADVKDAEESDADDMV